MLKSRLTPLLAAAGLSAMMGLAGCAGTPGEPGVRRFDPAAERGEAFAARRCAGCHTVGADDGGAGEGPRFQDLSMRYNPLSLQKRFAEISQHGSGMMPPVTISRSEAEDLIAYFSSLQHR